MARLVPALFLAVTLAACGSSHASTPKPTATPELTVEQKLAVINGGSGESEFARILDKLQAGEGYCNPEPSRIHVADVIVASWQRSGKKDSLLEWARALLLACG